MLTNCITCDKMFDVDDDVAVKGIRYYCSDECAFRSVAWQEPDPDVEVRYTVQVTADLPSRRDTMRFTND